MPCVVSDMDTQHTQHETRAVVHTCMHISGGVTERNDTAACVHVSGGAIECHTAGACTHVSKSAVDSHYAMKQACMTRMHISKRTVDSYNAIMSVCAHAYMPASGGPAQPCNV